MRIAVGSDHAGFRLKEAIKGVLDALRVPYEDFGTASTDPVDYPDVARDVGRSVASGRFDRGILVCGTGIGMAIAANKVPGVRAAPATTPELARLGRAHNDANILALGGRVTSPIDAEVIVRAFLDTPFDGGRHERRVSKIADIERAHPITDAPSQPAAAAPGGRADLPRTEEPAAG